jgi:hypothetical protein
MNRNEATADCECGYASGSAPRLSSQAVSQKSAWNHKQSLRTASSLRSIPQVASSLAGARSRAAESNRSVDMPVAHPLAAFGRALSLRSLLRTALARRGATPAGVSLSLSLSLSLLASGSHWHRRLQDSQPASACLPCERERESGREREREGEGERERVAAAQLAPRRRDRDQRQRPQRQPADLRVLRSVSRAQIDPWINRSGGGGGPKRLKRGLT